MISQLDQKAFYWINSHHSPWTDFAMGLLSDRYFWILIATALLIVAIIRKSKKLRRFFLIAGLSVFFADLISFRLLKPHFQRLRPCYAHEVRLQAPSCGGDYGFPSNHAANGFAFATTLWILYRKRYLLVGFLIASLVAYSRIYLGVHYPLDVIAGAGVGVVVATGNTKTCYWLAKLFPRG